MLRSELCDFSDVYIIVKGKVTASFNPRRANYGNNDFSDVLFPDNIFPEGSADQKKLQLGMLLKQMLLILQTLLVIEETI